MLLIHSLTLTPFQISQAVSDFSKQLERAGIRPIKLMVIATTLDPLYATWAGLPGYISSNPFRVPDGPPSITTTFLDLQSTRRLTDLFKEKATLHFKAEEGKTVLNDRI